MEKDYVDIVKLIRSIQKAEGYTDCFRRSLKNCNQTGCAWRVYCFEGGLSDEGVDRAGQGLGSSTLGLY